MAVTAYLISLIFEFNIIIYFEIEWKRSEWPISLLEFKDYSHTPTWTLHVWNRSNIIYNPKVIDIASNFDNIRFSFMSLNF